MRFLEAETEQTIPQRFEQQLIRSPNSIAVKTLTDAVSYSELDRLSNHVGNAVLHRGSAGRNTVALLFKQGISSIIAILGVLKAGRIYVCLDPSLQVMELVRILEDCSPEIVITSEDCLPIAKRLWPGKLEILTLEKTASYSPEMPPSVSIAPDSPAYIFYTSGSTGRPKGVVDSHRNVLHNVLRYTNSLRVDGHDNLSMIQACNFSGTVSSLFTALLNGGTVCPFNLADESIESLANFLVATRVTIFHSVPTIFEHLILAGQNFPDMRVVRLEGDRVESRHIHLFKRHSNRDCQLAIGLGATETGLSRQYLLSQDSDYPEACSPIGYAVEGMEISLIDEMGREVRPGEPGEIQVRSRYLASGYWRQPQLTKERFEGSPQGTAVRSYRTGDRGRVLADGCMLYLGRKDFRLKLHGVGIEASDVERALCCHPLVCSALVQVAIPRRGLHQLVAYLVICPGSVVTVSELRDFLCSHLSSYMIPARYEFLADFPVDRNGKISRTSLPPVGTQRPSLLQAYEPPATEQQIVLAQCFEEVLSLAGIGIADSFYDLGGDSLMLMQLLLLVEETIGLTFPEEKFFESPTIKTIERYLMAKPSRAQIITLQPDGDKPPLFCLHNQLGLVMHYRSFAQLLRPEVPVLGVQAAAIPEHVTAISIEALAAEYIPLIKEKQNRGPYYLCGNCFDGLLAFEVAQQLVRQGEVVAFLGLIDTACPAGAVLAAARRVQLADNPLRELAYMLTRKILRPLTSLPATLVGIFARPRKSQVDEKPSSTQKIERQLSELSDNRTSKLMESAAVKYCPKPYAGEITLFYTGSIGNCLGWHRLAKGGYFPVQLATKTTEVTPHLILHPLVIDLVRVIRQSLK